VDDSETSLSALVPAIADRMPELLEEVRTALEGDWPDYAAFLRENHLEVAVAADAALHRLVTLVEAGDGEGAGELELFEEIGRQQWQQGRDLTHLLAAYQVGARVFWHHVSAVAVESAIAPRTLAALAEAVFLFVDRLSSSSARGYVLAQSEAAANRGRLRDELVGLLLSDRAGQAAVRAAAARSDWRVPAEIAVVLVEPDNPLGHRALARLDATHLVFHRPPLLGAIIADPSSPGLRARLAAALRGAQAVVGVAVTPDRLPASLHVAEIAARLQRTGVLPDDPVFTDEHLDAIIVHRDARMLEALRSQVLAPLAGSTPSSRERMCETLVAWLRYMGDRQAIAAALHVHPQTVRYRMARLHELFGDQLNDPEMRGRLSLALGWGAPRESVVPATAPRRGTETPTSRPPRAPG
jgi:hypothetical protein